MTTRNDCVNVDTLPKELCLRRRFSCFWRTLNLLSELLHVPTFMKLVMLDQCAWTRFTTLLLYASTNQSVCGLHPCLFSLTEYCITSEDLQKTVSMSEVKIGVTKTVTDKIWNMFSISSVLKLLWCWIKAGKVFLHNIMMSQWSWPLNLIFFFFTLYLQNRIMT